MSIRFGNYTAQQLREYQAYVTPRDVDKSGNIREIRAPFMVEDNRNGTFTVDQLVYKRNESTNQFRCIKSSEDVFIKLPQKEWHGVSINPLDENTIELIG